ncbi:dienelactone hydrolase family protein [bacterium]|nr:dienelactone hydrolase family protein [bacterium]MBU1983621.1 dienelactone hydrolase family protein [bacterium]
MPIRSALFLSVILVFLGIAQAAETVTRERVVPASPYQAFAALTVEWQMRQWNEGVGVTSDVRPGGAWRLSYSDGRMDEGLYEITDRGTLLRFSWIRDEKATTAEITFAAEGKDTRITIRHDVPGTDRAARRLRQSVESWWDNRLSRLESYLTDYPGGYLARPDRQGPQPAVLVLHDGFGMSRNARAFCDSLAARGYVALAVDMFRGEVTSDLTEAARFMALVKEEDALDAVNRGLAHLRTRKDVNPARIAVWGLGYGGTAALRLATTDPRLKGCVAWHPSSAPPEELLPRISAPVLLVFGDSNVQNPHPEITAIVGSLTQAGVRVENSIQLAGRRFSDPGYGVDFSGTATAAAWRITLQFLDRQLRL